MQSRAAEIGSSERGRARKRGVCLRVWCVCRLLLRKLSLHNLCGGVMSSVHSRRRVWLIVGVGHDSPMSYTPAALRWLSLFGLCCCFLFTVDTAAACRFAQATEFTSVTSSTSSHFWLTEVQWRDRTIVNLGERRVIQPGNCQLCQAKTTPEKLTYKAHD